ncbi:MAG: hypothetical protein JWM57_553, partial [Phycisphaerales bacterium]|nr:hypothetical protein [Phycisphaerales bacterium]
MSRSLLTAGLAGLFALTPIAHGATIAAYNFTSGLAASS